jgi:hypothetical protein
MPTQRRLPLILSPDQSLDDLWERLPASRQREVIVRYAQVIARAVQAGVPLERKEPRHDVDD